MLRIERKVFEKVILQIIDSADMRELVCEFSKNPPFFHSLLSDISKGKDSPNYHLLERVAGDKKVNEEFIVQQAKSILSFFAPDRPKDDYYETLRVLPTADTREIRKSWLKLVTAYHPDKVGDEGLSITKKLNEAYEVLRDPVKRSQYDARLSPAVPVVVMEPWRVRLASRKSAYSALAVVFIFAAVSYLVISGLPLNLYSERVELAKETDNRSEHGDKKEYGTLEVTKPPIPKASKSPLSNAPRNVISTNLTGLKEDKKTKEALKPADKNPPPKPESSRIEEPPSTYGENKGVLIAQVKEEGAHKKGGFLKSEKAPEENLKEVKYVVKKGDNLWGIARAFSTSVKDIQAINNLDSNRLDVGDVLVIYSAKREKPLKEASAKGNVEEKKVKESVGEPVATKQAKIHHENKNQVKRVSQPEVLKERDRKPVVLGERGKTAQSDVSNQGLEPVHYPEKESLYSFISEYVSAYKSRNMSRFVSFFDPDAKENGVEISKAISSYSRNFSSLDVIEYDIQVNRVVVEDDRASIDGDFTLTFKRRSEQKVKRSNGTISWFLSWHDNRWRIKEINYSLKGVKGGI